MGHIRKICEASQRLPLLLPKSSEAIKGSDYEPALSYPIFGVLEPGAFYREKADFSEDSV